MGRDQLQPLIALGGSAGSIGGGCAPRWKLRGTEGKERVDVTEKEEVTIDLEGNGRPFLGSSIQGGGGRK